MSEATCAWCRTPVGPDEGFRVRVQASGERAAFCRLEHVVPWVIRGARWPERVTRPAGRDGSTTVPAACSQCGQPLAGDWILLVHHRDRHRIVDAFCDAQHLRAWATAGGRFR